MGQYTPTPVILDDPAQKGSFNQAMNETARKFIDDIERNHPGLIKRAGSSGAHVNNSPIVPQDGREGDSGVDVGCGAGFGLGGDAEPAGGIGGGHGRD